MHESPDMLSVIAQCGGIWKYSVIKGLIKPATFRVWMNRQDYIIPVMRRWKGQGEWIYRIPNKFVERYWQIVPKHINEYAIYRSFALLLYYQEEQTLPLKNESFSRYVGDFPRRPFNGVYYTIDEELHPIVIIVDFYRPVKKIIEIIGAMRLPWQLNRSPYFHILTNKNRVDLANAIDEKYEYEQVYVYHYDQLNNIYG